MQIQRVPFSIWQPIEPNFFGYGDEQALAEIPRRKVWEGEVDLVVTDLDLLDEDAGDVLRKAMDRALEELFEEFNLRHPAGFRGHSLSVNDVVVLGESAFRCAPIGWVAQPITTGA